MGETLRKGEIVAIHRFYDSEPEVWIYKGVKIGSRTAPQLIVRALDNGEEQLIPFVEIERIEKSLLDTAPPRRRRRNVPTVEFV
jgi:hypothetical protein